MAVGTRAAGNPQQGICLTVIHAVGMGSATVPAALAGVSPASLRRDRPWAMSEQQCAATVFGETPKTAVVTTALPEDTEPFS